MSKIPKLVIDTTVIQIRQSDSTAIILKYTLYLIQKVNTVELAQVKICTYPPTYMCTYTGIYTYNIHVYAHVHMVT